ncbi:MAG: DUF2203 domain-containing protein [Acidobacteriia bacterium]|nr:DUF2203 domain-containing protein [Terriglobia bacterium]
MAEKYFKREEAEELLPLIEHCLRQARDSKQQVEGLDQELSQASARIMVLGGSLPAYGKLAATREQREKLVAQLQEALNQIQETGCLVKDLDEGLVDFPTLRKGEEVYLCWKLGEERIVYWHGLEEGFAGRKPLDDETAGEPSSGPERVQ